MGEMELGSKVWKVECFWNSAIRSTGWDRATCLFEISINTQVMQVYMQFFELQLVQHLNFIFYEF